MSRTERTSKESQRLVEDLLTLRALAAPPERDCQVVRRGQRALVFCAKQTGLVDEDLALDLHGLGVLALPRERERQVVGRVERVGVVSTENALPLLERASAECLRFCVLEMNQV